jgi:oligosaccharide repeat unit polymerase
MSTIRQDFTSIDNQDVNFSILKSIEPAVLTTNMIDVSKTAHIIEAIPNKIDYQYGYTLTTASFAWIPRFLWKSKPVSNVDNTIGMKVFGSNTYGSGGVPPGIFAELYWNFWIPGVLIGCFLIGRYLKIVHLTFTSYNSNKNSLLIYVIVFMLNGIWLIGSSFSSTLIGLLTTLFPLILILNFITIRSNNIK